MMTKREPHLHAGHGVDVHSFRLPCKLSGVCVCDDNGSSCGWQDLSFSVPFDVSEAFFVLTWASLQGRREQIKLETQLVFGLIYVPQGWVRWSAARKGQQDCTVHHLELLQGALKPFFVKWMQFSWWGNKQVSINYKLFNTFYISGCVVPVSTSCPFQQTERQPLILSCNHQ